MPKDAVTDLMGNAGSLTMRMVCIVIDDTPPRSTKNCDGRETALFLSRKAVDSLGDLCEIRQRDDRDESIV
jgi:hypothetical protein